ncbi:Oidioi.mRNA.OKI2018_I69.chr2.g6601.t1.cds [Oikopleura dioica]|uniref:Oidioi.mRNA.OKI2018_I69.chr2.g6601.t1.cds n=1 Tax=Oikopleura dioica TaxID=34765 RepID=A0ABN7T9P2_OIKDI|nr:Oidioi.mRNA.OKI2018_I69.chr2.g6601.t1.cds [Oikopleura dioica]
MSSKGIKFDARPTLPARPSMGVVMDDIEKTCISDVLFDYIQQNCQIDKSTEAILEKVKNKTEAARVREELRQTSLEAAEFSKAIIKNLPASLKTNLN